MQIHYTEGAQNWRRDCWFISGRGVDSQRSRR